MSTLRESFLSLFPKFYHGEIMLNRRQNKAAIIFEDLEARGYKMSEKRSFLDYEHLALMMRKLGEFHAYSYKAKNTIPDSFYPMANMFQEINSLLICKQFSFITQRVPYRGLKFSQQHSKLEQYADRLRELVGKSDDIFRQVLTKDGDNPISVITHGDYLRGNLMFRYKNGIPDDLIIIDMDSYRYASPVVDLAIPLYLNVDQATRDKYWDKLIDEYYTSLKNTFPDNKVPSKDQILSDFVGKSFYAYVVASYFLPLMIAKDGNKAFSDDVDSDIVKKFLNLDLDKIPMEMWFDLYMQVGGERGTQALNDILQDMIDRKFICT
ncbi:uncharacterized protein LOC135847406 [Planococcus citri]|uniref:uncharacterized protein LOC135847406 n=1 Tax=Planococcus citri TaxID=170843 RepID=UPI0031F96AB2